MLHQFVQVRDGGLLIYNQSDYRSATRNRHVLGPGKTYSGTVTSHSAKRIKCALDILLQRSPQVRIFNPISESYHDFRINFTTLTVAAKQNITAREAYDKLLAEWLRYMRRKCGLRDYLWKAELQERGQIHYHVATNTFIDYRTIKWRWNSLQKRAGLLVGYHNKYGHWNPNGTDIHAVHKVQDIHAYLAKYLAKSSQNTKATVGKVWDASLSLKISRFAGHLDYLTEQNIKTAAKFGKASVTELEHCVFIKTSTPEALLSPTLQIAYRKHIN